MIHEKKKERNIKNSIIASEPDGRKKMVFTKSMALLESAGFSGLKEILRCLFGDKDDALTMHSKSEERETESKVERKRKPQFLPSFNWVLEKSFAERFSCVSARLFFTFLSVRLCIRELPLHGEFQSNSSRRRWSGSEA